MLIFSYTDNIFSLVFSLNSVTSSEVNPFVGMGFNASARTKPSEIKKGRFNRLFFKDYTDCDRSYLIKIFSLVYCRKNCTPKKQLVQPESSIEKSKDKP